MTETKYVGEWKTVALPIPERSDAVKGVKLPNGKCMIGDEPIIVKMRILPAEGSVLEHVTGEFKGGAIKNADRTGDCPECSSHVPLSSKGYVTAHVVKGGSLEPSSMLTEPQVDPTDTGSRIGDPRTAAQRRTVEIDGAFEHGTVEIPVKGKNGRTKLEDAPATEENVRAALEYWRTRKPRSESARTDQNTNVSALARRLDAMRKAEVIQHAPVDAPVTTDIVVKRDAAKSSMGAAQSPEGLKSSTAVSPLTGKPLTVSGASPGPALVKGRSEAPLAGEVTVRQVGELFVAPAPAEDNRRNDGGTWAAPTGRDRMDAESSTVPILGGTYGYLTQTEFDALGCDHGPLGIGVVCDSPDCARRFRTRSRKYWDKINKQTAYAAKKRAEGRKRLPVRLGTGAMGSSSFADGDSRETERIMRQPKS